MKSERTHQKELVEQSGCNINIYLHALLDGDETDQFPVELVKLILDTFLEHEFFDGTSRLGVGHIRHVLDFFLAFLATDFRGAFTPIGLVLFLAAFGVGLVQAITKTNHFGVGVAPTNIIQGWA